MWNLSKCKNLTCCFSNWGAMLRSLEHSWRSLTRSSMVETTSSNWTLVFRIPSACFSYRSRYSLTRACAVKLVSQKRIESLATRNSRAYWKKDTQNSEKGWKKSLINLLDLLWMKGLRVTGMSLKLRFGIKLCYQGKSRWDWDSKNFKQIIPYKGF